MTTLSRIERVLRHDGIVAVLDLTAEQAQAGDCSWVGEDRWKPIVLEAVRLRQIAGEPSVRVLVGEHAVLVSGDDRHVVGVVFIKGHPVVKSVVRMVRQLLRAGAPAAKPAPAPAAAAPAPTQAVPAPVVTPAPAPAAPAPAAPTPAPVAAPSASVSVSSSS
jgi:pyruvate/2-oxoglutarate dehydrogenase complex dihydrolipoamide acyltransferase (E2) component